MSVQVIEAISSDRVAESADAARVAVDALLFDRRLASRVTALATEVRLAQAGATAAIDGIDFPESAWRTGTAFDDSPMGRAAAGVWRLERDLSALEPVWSTAPLQALARMHSLLMRDVIPDDELGRPRALGQVPDDPLRIGFPPLSGGPPEGSAGGSAAAPMPIVGRVLIDSIGADQGVPAVVRSALVHGTLLAERPFARGSGLVARYAGRLTMATRGLDPDFLVASDVALAAAGRPAYVRAIRAFMTGIRPGGRADDVASWMCFVCEFVERGARISLGNL